MSESGHDLHGDWRRPALRGALVIGLTFGVFGTWSCLARIDSAVVANGNIAVETERKPVQHLEGGIVGAILVTDGQRVESGQVLLRIEPTQARAQADMARNAVTSSVVEEARLAAEAEGKEEFDPPASLSGKLSDPEARRAVDDQSRQFRERKSARRNEVQVLEERIAQAQNQIAGSKAQVAAARSQVDSITLEYDKLKPLADRGLVQTTRIATLDRSRTELVGRAGALESDIDRLGRSIQEARFQIEGVQRKFVEDAAGKLAEVRAKQADARDKLRVAEDVLTRLAVRSPRTGRIVNLKVHGPGAVVRPGDTLMEVVPEDDTLVVSARMSPLDVNHVHQGLPAEVRLPSFKSRSTPLAVGAVLGVGADALRDETTRQPYYDLKVSVQVSNFPAEIRDNLKPGMPAEVLVATGERTVIEYLTKPLADAMRRGMREN